MRPPATLKYQKWMGTTLSFRRSDAIHWTKKRPKKQAWPRKPTITHVVEGSMPSLPSRTVHALPALRPQGPLPRPAAGC
jgi:hypothetical protein